MLAVVFGASGSGKSTQAPLLQRRLPDVAVHDFDEIGGDRSSEGWRRRATSGWIERARAATSDVLVLGGVPGEVLASGDAVHLEGIAFCLLDCADVERVNRLAARAPEIAITTHQLWDHVAWGVWLRFHAADPAWWAGPIWSRWESWKTGDPRWRIERVDTTDQTEAETADALASWFRACRRELDAGTLPLSGRWWDG